MKWKNTIENRKYEDVTKEKLKPGLKKKEKNLRRDENKMRNVYMIKKTKLHFFFLVRSNPCKHTIIEDDTRWKKTKVQKKKKLRKLVREQ